MKLLVETTGDFMLVDMAAKTDIQENRPTLVTNTGAIGIFVQQKKLRIVEDEVPAQLTDELMMENVNGILDGKKNVKPADVRKACIEFVKGAKSKSEPEPPADPKPATPATPATPAGQS